MGSRGVGERIDAVVARYVGGSVPERAGLPAYVAPVPEWLENVGLRLAWLVVGINLVGTAFGFWFYSFQLAGAPALAWPLIPVSPLATLYMALSLAAWRLGRPSELLNALAFFGCVKYGLWTVFVQWVVQGPGYVPFGLWQFLIWSHAAMVLQALVIHRYSAFPVWAGVAAAGWYTFNDVIDYFIPILDGPHHTAISILRRGGEIDRTLPAFDQIAAGALVTTVLATVLFFVTRIAILESRSRSDQSV